MERQVLCLTILTLIVSQVHTCTAEISTEHRLVRNLTNPDIYDKRISPATHTSSPITVNISMALLSIDEVDESGGTITTHSWMRQFWSDDRLSWNPDDYDGITHVDIPGEDVWHPDIALYNSKGNSAPFVHDGSFPARVSSTGDVYFVFSIVLTSRCSFDMRHFPYDEHTCPLTFGSWFHNGLQMDFDVHDFQQKRDVGVSEYKPSMEWELMGHSGEKVVQKFSKLGKPYVHVTINLEIKRIEDFYTHSYILPGIVVSLLAPGIFALPVTGPHRYFLGVGLMITLTSITSSFHDVLPNTNSTPLIDRWFTALESLVVVALLLAILVTNFANRAVYGQEPPAFIRKMLLGRLATLLRLGKNTSELLAEDTAEGGANRPEQWEQAARVLDRLFFLVYCVLIILLALPWLASICVYA